MFPFVKRKQYSRQDIWTVVTGGKAPMTRNFQQSGYERINEDLFAFINIGYKGNAGQIFPNQYDARTETLMWYGKKQTHSRQPLMKSIIDGFTTVYCFARWDPKPQFTFLGVGRVVNYRDNFTEVYERDGTQTFCLEFELDCRDGVNPAFIGNFDDLEEGVLKQLRAEKDGLDIKPVRETQKSLGQKKQFRQEYGRLFCEVCGFDFHATYGEG